VPLSLVIEFPIISLVFCLFFKSALQLFIEVHIFVHDFSIRRNSDREQDVSCVPTNIYIMILTHFASYYSSLETNLSHC
jgi:hypothetical protein